MKYPCVSNWLVYNRINPEEYEIRDALTQDTWIADREAVSIMRQLDGKKSPYACTSKWSHNDIDQLIEELEEMDLLRVSRRILAFELGTVMLTLWIPKCGERVSRIVRLLNIFLIFSWIPLLCVGFILNMNISFRETGTVFSLVSGTIAGLLIGLILHEIGHAIAGLAYGNHLFEFGFMLYYFIPGAYTLIDNNVKNRWKNIQIYMAGIEMNFLLAGVMLILRTVINSSWYFFTYAAIMNIAMGLLNMLLVEGLDGMKIFSILLGSEEIIELSKRALFNKKVRSRVIAKGVNGYAFIVFGAMILVFQIALPITILLNIVVFF